MKRRLTQKPGRRDRIELLDMKANPKGLFRKKFSKRILKSSITKSDSYGNPIFLNDDEIIYNLIEGDRYSVFRYKFDNESLSHEKDSLWFQNKQVLCLSQDRQVIVFDNPLTEKYTFLNLVSGEMFETERYTGFKSNVTFSPDCSKAGIGVFIDHVIIDLKSNTRHHVTNESDISNKSNFAYEPVAWRPKVK